MQQSLREFLDSYAQVSFEGEGDDSGGTGGATTFTQADIDAAVAAVTKPTGFSQADIDTAVIESGKKQQKLMQKALDELEAVKATIDLTGGDRTAMDEKIADLQNQILTKEEIATRNESKLKKDSDEALGTLQGKYDALENRYNTETITRAITEAAVAGKAYSTEPLVALLKPQTRLVEIENAEGEKTGRFEPRVDYPTKDKDGKDVVMNMTVPEAITQMRETESFLNLFLAEGTSGVGGTNRGKGTELDVAQLAKDNPQEYAKLRAEGKIELSTL